jgi:hypothetical protein
MSIDLGGSLTKTIVRSGETEIPFLLPPHVNRLPNRESLPNLVGNARTFNQQIFVGFDDRYYAVGDLARRVDREPMFWLRARQAARTSRSISPHRRRQTSQTFVKAID